MPEGLLVLVRHGNCLKNVEKRHGGAGSSLTEKGISEAQTLAMALAKRGIAPASMFVVDRPQCKETAEYLAPSLGHPLSEMLAFEPYNLGVLAGLSEAECKSRYPDLALALERYRRGGMEIAEVKIPGASDPVAFFEAAQKTLRSLVRQLAVRNVVVVGTRSVLVGLLNIGLGRSPVLGGGYREIPWENCGSCILDATLAVVETSGVAI